MQHLVMEVPEEFRSEFTRDILSAIRDIAGSATFALHPFIVNTEAVAKSFGKRQFGSVRGEYGLTWRPDPHLYPRRIIRPDEPRMAHVDLGLTGDSAGVAVGWVEGFTQVRRSDSTFESMPLINFDLILEVKPPRNGEIEFENIRKLFYTLREQGVNLKWISFDTLSVCRQHPDPPPEGLHHRHVLDGQEHAALRRDEDGVLRRTCRRRRRTRRRCRRSCGWSAIHRAVTSIIRPISARIAPTR